MLGKSDAYKNIDHRVLTNYKCWERNLKIVNVGNVPDTIKFSVGRYYNGGTPWEVDHHISLRCVGHPPRWRLVIGQLHNVDGAIALLILSRNSSVPLILFAHEYSKLFVEYSASSTGQIPLCWRRLFLLKSWFFVHWRSIWPVSRPIADQVPNTQDFMSV